MGSKKSKLGKSHPARNYKMEEKQQTEEKGAIKHMLVPKHIKLSEEQRSSLLEKYNISLKQLPKIKITDPALKGMELKIGDLILIKRKSQTTGETEYYRAVING